jgi:hypothetical protein
VTKITGSGTKCRNHGSRILRVSTIGFNSETVPCLEAQSRIVFIDAPVNKIKQFAVDGAGALRDGKFSGADVLAKLGRCRVRDGIRDNQAFRSGCSSYPNSPSP